MSFSPISKASLQAAVLSGISNVLAQFLQAWRSGSPFRIDATPIFNFVFFAALNTPPNFLWQQFLEDTFPAYIVTPQIVETKESPQATKDSTSPETRAEIVPKRQLNKRNTVIKILLDQTLGAFVNSVVFLASMAFLRGQNSDIAEIVKRDTLPLMLAGYKLWPLVSVLSFTVIPVQHRLLFGSLVGMGWGIFLSLFASH